MRTVFLEGARIFLGPLSGKADFNAYACWLNEQRTTKFMETGAFPSDKNCLKEYVINFTKNKNGMLLGIFLKKSKRHIGTITLHMIDWRNKHAEIGILIGDKKQWGKGYATEAIILLTRHAFDRLNLHKLGAGMMEGNEASKRAFAKAGFKEEGLLREHFYLNREYRGCYRLGLIKREQRGGE